MSVPAGLILAASRQYCVAGSRCPINRTTSPPSSKVSAPPEAVGQVGYELFGMKAFFSGDWKILKMPQPYGTGEWQLFDLKQDPGELNDMSKQRPNQLEALVAMWDQYRKDNGVLDVSFDVADQLK